MNLIKQLQSFILNFIGIYGIDIIWIFILFFIGKIIFKKIVKHTVGLAADYDKKTSEQRSKTIGHIIITAGNVVIYAIVFFMILNTFGVDIMPIITGAGIIALVIGFGLQVLVKDLVSGLFIIIENQYNIGDKIKVGLFEGKVIKISIRSTVLKDENGKIYYLSNGLINNVINLSQGKRYKK